MPYCIDIMRALDLACLRQHIDNREINLRINDVKLTVDMTFYIKFISYFFINFICIIYSD